VLAGTAHVKDFFAPGRGISLAIPASAKPRIHERARRILTADNLTGAVAAVAMLVDDTLVLVVAVATLTRKRLPERGGRHLELLSGAVLLLLGLVLLLRPEWLT
jgi:hypothetical protein